LFFDYVPYLCSTMREVDVETPAPFTASALMTCVPIVDLPKFQLLEQVVTPVQVKLRAPSKKILIEVMPVVSPAVTCIF
jgi:hypothetical protein